MYGLSIDITDRDVRQALDRIEQGVDELKLHSVVGRSARNLVKQHLLDYNRSHPNQMGAPRSNYWAAAARSVSFSSEPGAVLLSIAHPGVALRYFGGVVKPVNSKLLTIPAIPEAYGRRAKEFDNLELIGSRKHGFLALVERQSDNISFGRKRKDGSRKLKQGPKRGGRIFFWLVPETHHKPDPSVLPPDDVMTRHISDDTARYLQTLVDREAAHG